MENLSVTRLPSDPKPRTNRARFNLRTLFVIVFVSAVATWWILIPTQEAQWLAAEVNNRKSDVAQALVKPFEKDESWQRLLVQHLANGKQVQAVNSKTEVSIAPLTFADIVLGHRRFTVKHGYDVETFDGGRHYGYSISKGKMTRNGIR